MREYERDAYLKGSDEFRRRVKLLMEKKWQRKGVDRQTRKAQWPVPSSAALKRAEEDK